MSRRLIYTTLVLIALSSCGKQKVELEGFDKAAWQADTYGCNDTRMAQLEVVKANRELLLEKTQNEIKSVLGSPDEHELYERTRKFFYYYLEPSDKCGDSTNTYPRILQIRFNALDISNEIFIKNE